MPGIELQKAVLHLDCAPLILRCVPALRNKAGGSGDRSRIPGPVGQIGGEYFTFVCCDEHVIGGCLLGEYRHLPLDQGHAAVGAARATGILEHPFLDDLRTEARGGAAQRCGIKPVLFMRADHQQPALPLLPDQILRKTVGQHRTRRCRMDHIGAAVFLAQPIVDRSGVEQHDSAVAHGIGGLQQRIRRKIGNDEADVATASSPLLPSGEETRDVMAGRIGHGDRPRIRSGKAFYSGDRHRGVI